MTDSDKLPGIIIVFLIASGVLVFILLFIFAKRQIRRFTLRSRKGPHVPVGFGASSALRREINRRLDRVAEIKCEPRLLLEGNGITEDSDSVYWRMKTVDAVKDLESELGLHHNVPKRYPGDSLRAYLLSLEKGPLAKAQTDAVKQYCDLYEHARFHPAPYGKTEHLQFQETHEDILKSIWNTESCTVSDINRKTVVSHSSATPRQRPLPGASGGGVAFRSLSSSRDPAAQALLAEDTTHPNGQL